MRRFLNALYVCKTVTATPDLFEIILKFTPFGRGKVFETRPLFAIDQDRLKKF